MCPYWGQAGSLLCLWPPDPRRGKNCIFLGDLRWLSLLKGWTMWRIVVPAIFPSTWVRGRVSQLKEYPISCKLKPTFSSTQDQALHIRPLPTSPASSATTTPHTPSQWPSHRATRHSPDTSASLCTCSPFFPLDYLILYSRLKCPRWSLPCLGRARPLFWPLRASCAGVCLWLLPYCAVTDSTLPPLPGPLEARTVPRSPVRPQGLTEPGMKPVAVKSDCIKERGSLPSTVSHCCPLASLCNY